MKPQSKKKALKMNKQTITKLNSDAMNQVNGAGDYPTVGGLSEIMFNCNSSCIPTLGGDVYCNPTLPTVIDVS